MEVLMSKAVLSGPLPGPSSFFPIIPTRWLTKVWCARRKMDIRRLQPDGWRAQRTDRLSVERREHPDAANPAAATRDTPHDTDTHTH